MGATYGYSRSLRGGKLRPVTASRNSKLRPQVFYYRKIGVQRAILCNLHLMMQQ